MQRSLYDSSTQEMLDWLLGHHEPPLQQPCNALHTPVQHVSLQTPPPLQPLQHSSPRPVDAAQHHAEAQHPASTSCASSTAARAPLQGEAVPAVPCVWLEGDAPPTAAGVAGIDFSRHVMAEVGHGLAGVSDSMSPLANPGYPESSQALDPAPSCGHVWNAEDSVGERGGRDELTMARDEGRSKRLGVKHWFGFGLAPRNESAQHILPHSRREAFEPASAGSQFEGEDEWELIVNI